MQCHVMAVGRPRPVVTRAQSTAKGLTTPMWTWATSNPPSASLQQPWCQRVHGQLERQPERQPVDEDAIDLVDEPTPLTVVARGGREDDHLVPAADQAFGEVMNLHLDAAQAGQITVRQQSNLHECHLRMRQDGT